MRFVCVCLQCLLELSQGRRWGGLGGGQVPYFHLSSVRVQLLDLSQGRKLGVEVVWAGVTFFTCHVCGYPCLASVKAGGREGAVWGAFTAIFHLSCV